MKLSRYILLIILIIPLYLPAHDQKLGTTSSDTTQLFINRLETGRMEGNIKVVQDPRLTTILRRHYEYNRNTILPAWRILIYKGGEMKKANQMKAEFEESFSSLGMEVIVKYSEPDFSTLVGAFRTKEDAFRYKQMLSVRFPQAYLVSSKMALN